MGGVVENDSLGTTTSTSKCCNKGTNSEEDELWTLGVSMWNNGRMGQYKELVIQLLKVLVYLNNFEDVLQSQCEISFWNSIML